MVLALQTSHLLRESVGQARGVITERAEVTCKLFHHEMPMMWKYKTVRVAIHMSSHGRTKKKQNLCWRIKGINTGGEREEEERD